MRVILVSPPYGEGPQLVMPLGMMNIATYVGDQFGDQVEVEVRDFSSREPHELDLLDTVDWSDVGVVGFSVYSSHLQAVRLWAEHLHTKLPDAMLVAGGPHPTLAWEDFVVTHGEVFDAVVVGEGERPFTRLVEMQLRGEDVRDPTIPGVAVLRDGSPHLTPVGETVDPASWPNLLNATMISEGADPLTFSDPITGQSRSAVALTTSRSCPMRCYFCSIIAMPDKYRSATPEQVTGWLVEEQARNPFEHAYLMDADFFTTRQRVMAFAETMHAALPHMTWSTSATVGHLLRLQDDLPRLYECGLRLVEMGIEAGSNEQLEFLGKKNFGKPATWQQSLRAVRALQRNGIGIGVDYIMFYPHQTLTQLAENLVFLRRAALLDEEVDDHYWNELVLYPGTALRDFYEQLNGTPFGLDQLPDTDGLYVDAAVRRIKHLFLGDYRRGPHQRVIELREQLKSAALAASDATRAAELRLTELHLRHVPYQVLETLILSRGDTLTERVPWLESELAAAKAQLLEKPCLPLTA